DGGRPRGGGPAGSPAPRRPPAPGRPRDPVGAMTGRAPGPAVLTSAANPRLRAAVALRDRRDRVRRGRLLVDGAREVSRALDAGVALVEAFVAAGPSP